MRKYFLTTAVALLSASNVYAENPAAIGLLNVMSRVEIVDEIDCSDHLSLAVWAKEEGGDVSMTASPTGEISNISGANLVYSMATPAVCSISNNTFVNVENFEAFATDFLRGDIVGDEISGDTQPTTDFTVSDFTYLLSDGGKSVSIGATFNFKNITKAYYQALVLLTYTY